MRKLSRFLCINTVIVTVIVAVIVFTGWFNGKIHAQSNTKANTRTNTKSTLIVPFFQDLYHTFSARYLELKVDDYRYFCESNGLKEDDPGNRRKFLEIHFHHDLFTGTAAVTGLRGGILNIPYFWHYVKPNPRHSIQFLPGSKALSKVKPPPAFAKYKTFADIDRLPSLYLSDLLSAEPKFSHKACGTFYTFGWCSEREMAFRTLLHLLGYESKIRQQGIHVRTQIWMQFVTNAGRKVNIVAEVDNTFDLIDWRRGRINKTKWQKDFGKGTDIKWYNRVSKAKKQLDAVKKIKVPKETIKRIKNRVSRWLKQK